MDVVEFGRTLIKTGDLDPVYIALAGAELPQSQLIRWCLSYWMFYHVGVSSKLSEVKDGFWAACAAHAGTPASKRGTERRHFRGLKASLAVSWLANEFPDPRHMITKILTLPRARQGGPLAFSIVAAEAQRWPMFGPWIAFKVADMIDRCLKVPVDFSGCELGFYADPLKGGFVVNEFRCRPVVTYEEAVRDYNQSDGVARQAALSASVAYLLKEFRRYKAPPFNDRPIGVQEVETILCKYKSHLGGHYPLGKDTREYRAVLGSGEWGSTAGKLAKYLP